MADFSISEMLRQKALMDQLRQITSQGVQSDMIQSGLGKFQSADPQQQQLMPSSGGSGLLNLALGGRPTGNESMATKVMGGLSNKGIEALKSAIQGPSTGPPSGYIPPPVTSPQILVNRTPSDQPTPGPGEGVDVDPDTGKKGLLSRMMGLGAF